MTREELTDALHLIRRALQARSNGLPDQADQLEDELRGLVSSAKGSRKKAGGRDRQERGGFDREES